MHRTRTAPQSAHRSYSTPQLLAWREATDGALTALAVGSLPFLLLEIIRDDLTRGDRITLNVVNLVVLVAFLVDLVVELLVVKHRWSYLRADWATAVIVFAQVAALSPALSVVGLLRVLRVARLLRPGLAMVRLVGIGRSVSDSLGEELRRHTFRFALSIAAITWLSAGSAVLLAEGVGSASKFHTIVDGLWWSAATMTTVGYGDIIPTTLLGRAIGIGTMFVGISVFAVVTAKVASFLVKSEAA